MTPLECASLAAANPARSQSRFAALRAAYSACPCAAGPFLPPSAKLLSLPGMFEADEGDRPLAPANVLRVSAALPDLLDRALAQAAVGRVEQAPFVGQPVVGVRDRAVLGGRTVAVGPFVVAGYEDDGIAEPAEEVQGVLVDVRVGWRRLRPSRE
jgi:hypothetical protein